MHISKLPIIIILLLLVTPAAWCQYDRAVVAMTKMDYVYYNMIIRKEVTSYKVCA